MRCFAERSGAKYGRAKCNERTAYTVLGEPNGAIAEWECNVPCVFLKNLSILFRFWWAFYYCIWFFCFEKWKRGWGWIPFFKTPYSLMFVTDKYKSIIDLCLASTSIMCAFSTSTTKLSIKSKSISPFFIGK